MAKKPAKRKTTRSIKARQQEESEIRNKRGRPKADIDPEQVRQLAMIDCTQEEIAAVVGCSVDTLANHFSEIMKAGREQGKMSLRRAQFKNALKGSTGMQIWLGKNRLGQKDQVVVSPGGADSISNLSDEELIREAESFSKLKNFTEERPALPAREVVEIGSVTVPEDAETGTD